MDDTIWVNITLIIVVDQIDEEFTGKALKESYLIFYGFFEGRP